MQDMDGHINTLVFDSMGSRMWAGDSHGLIQEYSFDSPVALNSTLNSARNARSGSGGSAMNATLSPSPIQGRQSGAGNNPNNPNAGAPGGAEGSGAAGSTSAKERPPLRPMRKCSDFEVSCCDWCCECHARGGMGTWVHLHCTAAKASRVVLVTWLGTV